MNGLIRLAGALILVAVVSVTVSNSAAAAPSTKVTGGGTGTFGADLDGDGDIDGSHFGIGVNVASGGAANGHFECLMAGNADILGLPNMAVSGKVTGGVVNSATNVTLTGVAKVILGNGNNFVGVPFIVTLTEGGAGAGTIQLHLMGGYAGGPGNFDLPVEHVATGRIDIQ